MSTGLRRVFAALVASVMCCASVTLVRAEDAPKTGWTDVAELSLVATDGNSESTSFGFKNTLERRWERAQFTFKVGGIRVESFDGDRTAVLEPGGNIRTIDPPTQVTAERYYANTRYGHEFTKRTFWYVGLNWERDEDAGVDDRYIAEAGLGNLWRDDERVRFLTRYAATYTDESLDTEDNEFGGYRLAYDYRNKLTDTATFNNELIFDGNFDESKDWRADFNAGLAVAMTSKVNLKVGAQFRYDNQPSFETVDLFDPAGTLLGQTDVELDELDTTLTASVVINFM